ncbi:hypothetical protein F5Y13DRAFT_189393 [Hypoxylon sp. FL1857]|nr:hypothetical protein F5Y13DRAFT_189393 [Hypoxylon sp. FL1857]
MPYLNPENENEKAKAYFNENKDKIEECFVECIECYDDVGFFVSTADNSPYSMCSTKHNMPYLKPENENDKAKAYFNENKEKIAEGFVEHIECFDSLISTTDDCCV